EALARGERVRPAVVPGDKSGARRRLEEPGDDFHRCGFAGAVGSKKSDDFSSLDAEAYAVDGRERSETFDEGARLDEHHDVFSPSINGPSVRAMRYLPGL